jgi:hypothetical protein
VRIAQLADVVVFPLAAATTPGVPGAVVTRKVHERRTYELRCSAPVRVAAGSRPSLAVEDVEVQPSAPVLVLQSPSGQVSMAASTSADTYAWLVPIEESDG